MRVPPNHQARPFFRGEIKVTLLVFRSSLFSLPPFSHFSILLFPSFYPEARGKRFGGCSPSQQPLSSSLASIDRVDARFSRSTCLDPEDPIAIFFRTIFQTSPFTSILYLVIYRCRYEFRDFFSFSLSPLPPFSRVTWRICGRLDGACFGVQEENGNADLEFGIA